jgi:AcrR family transcriptional regulator
VVDLIATCDILYIMVIVVLSPCCYFFLIPNVMRREEFLMNLKQKRKIELERQKDRRKEEVILGAIQVFKENGIVNAKMTDIAEKAQVGVASVYRYFKTKADLVIEAATMFWDLEVSELFENYNNKTFEKLGSIEKIKNILYIFIEFYENHKDFVRFIFELDNYIVNEQITKEKLVNYENSIIDLREVIFDEMRKGKEEGLIRKDISESEFYNTITHALMSLCEKLVLRGNILKSDKEVDGKKQIQLIIDMAVNYIENK